MVPARLLRLPRLAWRFLALPLAVWLLLTTTGTAGLLWLQRDGRDGLVQRYQLRVTLMADFVTSYVADLIDREQVAAAALLTDPVVGEREFTRTVAGFGYPAAVLLDGRGRAMQVAPANPALIGTDLASRYAHLRTALVEGRPAVSGVVPSAARGVPVVAFAVPFTSTAGRRVFSGAVEITHSPLSAYLSTALSLPGALVQLTDASGAIVAANEPDATTPTVATRDRGLAAALQRAPQGRYRYDGHWWWYASQAIAGTPWRLSATVGEDVLFASVAGTESAGRAAVATAAAVGLLVVAAATRARRSHRDLRLSEQRFRKVFDNSRTGMILADPTGRFVRVNPALCQMLGHAEPDLVGKYFTDITHPDDGTAGTDPARYVHADGHTIEASVTTALLRDESGRPQYLATQIIDVTERRALERAREQHEAELAHRAEQLQQANTQMSDFIAMLTHDVRQPLASVVALGEVLLDEWGDMPEDTKRNYVQRATTAGHRASQLVSDILTLAQMDAGALVARPVRLDVAHAVREAVAAHAGDHEEPVSVVAPDESSAFADPAHLQLVLGNLLGNAAKYGAPPISVTVTNDRNHVRIQITDCGEGVPPAFVARMFDRFARAESGVATTKPGTGLGLYFVRQLAGASGMTVHYRPNLPRGATFILTVPRTPGQSQDMDDRQDVPAAVR